MINRDDEKEHKELVNMELPEIIPPPPKIKRRSIEFPFADPPANTVEEEALERFEERYYRIESAMDEFENDVLGCEEKFFDEDSESEDLLSDELRLDKRIENAHESLDSLNEVISETRLEISEEFPLRGFQLWLLY